MTHGKHKACLANTEAMIYIKDICFFEVNTKYIISSSELKTSKFSRVRSTSENLYDIVFKSQDEIYLVFTDKK